MRKLKLQMQTTVDGFVGGLKGEQDWLTQDWDKDFRKYEYDLIDSSDTLLMGRGMTDEFFNYWTDVAENQPENVWYKFAQKMVDTPKIVFTKTLTEAPWANTTLARGDLMEEVMRLKNQPGKDLLVYGGASFVSSLIRENLIDEYNFFINPVAIGEGLTIFGRIADKKFNLKLSSSQHFDCGVVFNQYVNNRMS